MVYCYFVVTFSYFEKGANHMTKKQEIKAVSFVHVGDKLVNTDDMNDEQRRRLATWLKITYLNTLFQGKAEFFEVEDNWPD